MYTALEIGLELSDLLQWDETMFTDQDENNEHDFLNDDSYELPF